MFYHCCVITLLSGGNGQKPKLTLESSLSPGIKLGELQKPPNIFLGEKQSQRYFFISSGGDRYTHHFAFAPLFWEVCYMLHP